MLCYHLSLFTTNTCKSIHNQAQSHIRLKWYMEPKRATPKSADLLGDAPGAKWWHQFLEQTKGSNKPLEGARAAASLRQPAAAAIRVWRARVQQPPLPLVFPAKCGKTLSIPNP